MQSRMRSKNILDNDPKKPYLLCEFMHDMGNSMGGLGTYMHLIDKYDMYHGGFIWDFIDQALYVKDEVTGKEVLRYGGDFDDRPSDYEFFRRWNCICKPCGEAGYAGSEVLLWFIQIMGN